jgi:signal transduction histidine kinase
VDPADFHLTVESGFQFVHPDDRLATEQEFQDAVASRSDFKREFRIVRADGTIRHVLSVGRPRVGPTGDLTEYIGTIVDITDRRHDDDERRDLQRRLSISHEDERRRIARELHDEFGQHLSALAFRLAQLKRDVGRRFGLASKWRLWRR